MREDFNLEKFIEHKKNFDETDLLDGMSNNANLLGYYGYQQAEWAYAIENLKLQIDTRSAELDIEHREDCLRENSKFTDTSVKAYITAHEEIKRLKQALLKAKHEEALYKNAVTTIEQRGKMLISYNANRRNEMKQYGLNGIYNEYPWPAYVTTTADSAIPTAAGGDYKIHTGTIRADAVTAGKLSEDAKMALLKMLEDRNVKSPYPTEKTEIGE